MIPIIFDIETIPDQRPNALAEYIDDARTNFKAPSGITKDELAADLGILDPKEIKFTAKEKLTAMWEERFAETKADAVGMENWRKTALNGSRGEIVSIAWAVGDGEIISLHRDPIAWAEWTRATAPESYDPLNPRAFHSEAMLLRGFFEVIGDQLKDLSHQRKPWWVGHNIAGFDLRFIYQRAVINQVPIPIPFPHNGRHGQHFFDTMIEWAGQGNRIKLDHLCAALGLPGKSDDIDGSMVWDYVAAGEVAKVAEYNEHDVEITREAYKRLIFSNQLNVTLS